MIDRRIFLRNTGLMGVGILSVGQIETMAAKILRTANDQGIIRRSLATTFVLEDVLRLVHLQDFSNDFVESLQINRQLFHRGAAFKLSDGKWSDLIEQTGLTWGNKDSRDDGQTLLALLGGASMYAPIDLHIPVASSEIEDLVPPLSDEHIYHDVWIMKEIQNADPSSSTISLSEQLDTDPADVAELFHLIRQRNLIRMHTIRPEFSDVETWLSQVLSLQHLLEEENERYARVYCNPISAGIDKEMITFYDREDPIIQLARGMQMSVTELQYDLSNAIEQAGAQSIYAQVLGHCMQRLEHWYTYLQGTLSKDSLVKKLSA